VDARQEQHCGLHVKALAAILMLLATGCAARDSGVVDLLLAASASMAAAHDSNDDSQDANLWTWSHDANDLSYKDCFGHPGVNTWGDGA
jgi:hypothetical protein